MNRQPIVMLLALLVVGALVAPALWAVDNTFPLRDRSALETSTGTAYIDTSAATYTSYQALVTVTNPGSQALEDVRVLVDLDLTSTGFAEASGWDTETITLAVSRKVDGTNWRTDEASDTAALAADDADNACLVLNVGTVGPDEDVRIVVKVSAEAAADVALPYVVQYRGGARATITAATN